MIIRVPHRRQFTIIADSALRDGRISFRATGVLAYLLSLPDGTEISGDRLTNAKAEGRDAILKAMGELDAAGYLKRQRSQRPDGTWTTEVILAEAPTPGFQGSVPGNRHITSHQPSPGKPTVGKPGHKGSSTSDEYLEPAPWKTVTVPTSLDKATRQRGAEFFRELRQGGKPA